MNDGAWRDPAWTSPISPATRVFAHTGRAAGTTTFGATTFGATTFGAMTFGATTAGTTTAGTKTAGGWAE